MMDHEAIRTGAIAWSGEELALVLDKAGGPEAALHVAAARSRELGHDPQTATAHGMRLFAIMDFLHDHHSRLYELGLLLPRDVGEDVISIHLLDVLASFPFTRETGGTSPGGKPHLGFDADDVIIEAGRRQKAEGEQEESEGAA